MQMVGLEDLNVSMLSATEIIAVDPTTPLDDVAVLLSREHIGAVVMGPVTAPTGIISERDIVHAVADGRDMVATTAADVAQPISFVVDESASVADAARLMMDHWVRHLLVSHGRRVVGVVSARDLLGVYCTAEEPT